MAAAAAGESDAELALGVASAGVEEGIAVDADAVSDFADVGATSAAGRPGLEVPQAATNSRLNALQMAATRFTFFAVNFPPRKGEFRLNYLA
jgi:hypothetical protein